MSTTTSPPTSTSTSSTSRLLTCIRCKGLIDAKNKKLAVKDGFRIIDCPHCKWRGRSQHLLCECGLKWYLCQSHRDDPAVHQSRKPPVNKTAKKKAAERTLFSNRRAPTTRGTEDGDRTRRKKVPDKKMHTHHMNAHPHLSPEAAETLRSNWKRRRCENVEPPSQAVSQTVASGGDVRGPLAPCVASATYTAQLAQDDHLLDQVTPTCISTSSLENWRLRPGSTYSGPEVHTTYIDASGRLPLEPSTVSSAIAPWNGNGSDNKDGPPTSSSTSSVKHCLNSTSISSKRQCLSKVDAALHRDSQLKDLSRTAPRSRLSRLNVYAPTLSTAESPADERARSRSR
jgi:type II secretory pathway pseudopilin PulG